MSAVRVTINYCIIWNIFKYENDFIITSLVLFLCGSRECVCCVCMHICTHNSRIPQCTIMCYYLNDLDVYQIILYVRKRFRLVHSQFVCYYITPPPPFCPIHVTVVINYIITALCVELPVFYQTQLDAFPGLFMAYYTYTYFSVDFPYLWELFHYCLLFFTFLFTLMSEPFAV